MTPRPCFEDSRAGRITFALTCVLVVAAIAWRVYRIMSGQP